MNNFISSLSNPKINDVVCLRKSNERKDSTLFLIEGYREIMRAVESNWQLHSLFICPDFYLGTNEPQLIQKITAQKVPLYTCTDSVFKKISYRDRPDGLLAVAYQRSLAIEQLDIHYKKQTPFFVMAQSIEKPGNLGTILRSSDAVGVSGLIVCDRCTDVYNPNVVRASVGTLFTVPIADASSAELESWLDNKNIAILAATPHADKEYTDVDLTIPLVIAVGTEQLGLSERWMKRADLQVRIPMYGVADSLNVAMATTLLLYEARRQRNLQKKPISKKI